MPKMGNDVYDIDNSFHLVPTNFFITKAVAQQNGTVTSMTAYVNPQDDGWHQLYTWKYVMYDGSGNLLCATIPSGGGDIGWREIGGLSQAITKNSIYYLCITGNGVGYVNDAIGFSKIFGSSNYGGVYAGTNLYSSPPASIVLGNRTATNHQTLLYATYTPSGPADISKVEGIIPGKIEGISWGDVVDIN